MSITYKKFKNAKVQFNLLENIILTLIFMILENYDFPSQIGFNILIPKAKEINIGLSATKLLKKIRIKMLSFNNK